MRHGHYSHRILIVDDSDIIRSLLRITLEKSGYAADTAESAAEARNLLTTYKYDLIILDYMLSRFSTGFDLIKKMQAENYPLPPIIMLSADKSSNHSDSIQDFGIKAWIRKPFTPDSMQKILKQMLNDPEIIPASQTANL